MEPLIPPTCFFLFFLASYSWKECFRCFRASMVVHFTSFAFLTSNRFLFSFTLKSFRWSPFERARSTHSRVVVVRFVRFCGRACFCLQISPFARLGGRPQKKELAVRFDRSPFRKNVQKLYILPQDHGVLAE